MSRAKTYTLTDGRTGSARELAEQAGLPGVDARVVRSRIQYAQRMGHPLDPDYILAPKASAEDAARRGGQRNAKKNPAPAMNREADVKARVKRALARLGAWYTMPHQAGYSQAGVPDFLVCIKGHFIGIETKFGNNQPTPLQHRQLADIRRAGGHAFVVNETNVGELESILFEFAEGKR